MSNQNEKAKLIEQNIVKARELGFLHLYTTARENCRKLQFKDSREKIFFGSCSYLALETDPRLVQGAKEALDRFGTQFSSSRAYVSIGLYQSIESLLQTLFEAYPVVSATTTLGHLATLPTLVSPGDLLLLDKQVHNSVQMSAQICKAQGTEIRIIRHNDMRELEELLQSSARKEGRKVWYMADGIYSMFGDVAPVGEIRRLLDRYPFFYTYIDDAHGMSSMGKKGKGHVLGDDPIHPRMIVAISFAKATGAGGGAILFPNAQWQQKVRDIGPTLIFSGPIQPAVLGAIEASLRLHLSGEIEPLQQELQSNIRYFKELLAQKKIQHLSPDLTPITYIPMGSQIDAIIGELLKDGYYVNYAAFPAVPRRLSGVRITLNRSLRKEDLKGLVESLDHLIHKYHIHQERLAA